MIRNENARLLRRTAPGLAALPLALALSGCGTLTGLNAENDFSCPMTPGVSCRSLSDTYEDSVIMNNFCPLPIQPLAPPRPSQISPDRTSLRRQYLRTTPGAQPGIHPTDTQSF